MKIRYLILTLLVVFWVGTFMGKLDKDAMEVCQKKHSYDWCFKTIYN